MARSLASDSPEDGLGQSLWVDLVWAWRFRMARQRPLRWRRPAPGDMEAWHGHTEIARFGDMLEWVADVDGRLWLIVSRDWHGWPDPPEFAVFAVAEAGGIWMARDFARWPLAWVKTGETV